jgi:pyruvate formate lyase activating enzyme
MHPAQLWKPLAGGKVQCRLCAHFCVLADGQRGQCAVRINDGGALFTLVADRVAALAADPVEKKPLFHFRPGTTTLSLATVGCNMSCAFCQNASLSQGPRSGEPVQGRPADPAALALAAREHGCASLSYTYSEPTVFFELARATAQAARALGLDNILVSNGFMSPECLEALGPLIQAANIDLKAFSEDFYRELCGARLGPVLDNLRHIRALGWWLEVTTLVIPGLNDSDAELTALARFIATELGPDVPWHVSRFHPDHRLRGVPATPVATLERAWRLGRDAGLRFVYPGNVPGHDAESTRCPDCGALLLRRTGFAVRDDFLGHGQQRGRCPGCGQPVAGVW